MYRKVELLISIWKLTWTAVPRFKVCRLMSIPGPPIQKFSSNSNDKRPNSSLLPRPAWPECRVWEGNDVRKFSNFEIK